ncbi:MAG: hypothetical protein ABIF40_00560 [archaeon]
MEKRGQATLLIILGLVLLILIVLVVFLRSDILSFAEEVGIIESQAAGEMQDEVEIYVSLCLDQTAENALAFVSNYGGYYDLPSTADPTFLMPFYFYEGDSQIITKEELETEISKYLDNELYFCLQNFIDLENQGYGITTGVSETSVLITEDDIVFDVYFPILIIKDSVEISVTEFSFSMPSNLNTIYNVAEQLIQTQEEDSSMMCLSCMLDLAVQNDLRIEISYIDDRTYMITLIDDSTLIDGESFTYSFLTQYDIEEVVEEDEEK